MKKIFTWLIMALLVGLLAACGSSRDSADTTADTTDLGVDPATGIDYVGASTCISCHESFSWSDEIVADYLAGKHVIHSDHITAANEADGCLECHDPIGDGPALEPLVDAASVPEDGLAAVGCENCHGAGGEHYGSGPIPNASPTAETCGACHDTIPDSHVPHHPEAQGIYTKYTSSRHATASVRNEAICAKCHTDEGGRLYKDVQTIAALEGSVLPVGSDAAVQCRTCHNPHNAGGLLMEEIEDHGHVVASAEFATCTTCHMSPQVDLTDATTPAEELAELDEGVIYHQDRHYRVIADTHYDNPNTTDVIEGYVTDHHEQSGLRACLECHDVHGVMEIRTRVDSDTGIAEASSGINEQWAQSAHGGFLLQQKMDTMEASADERSAEGLIELIKAGTTEATGAAAWIHYDWDATTKLDTDGTIVLDRGDCQQCHTATGAKNFLTDPANYDPLNNDFSYLDGWSLDGGPNGETVSSGQNEMLYCWGCHENNSGDLRNPGSIPRPYEVGGVTVTIPDVGNSNVCINCHGARGNMESYNFTAEDPTVDYTSLNAGFGPGTKNVTEAHYLVAAATIYAADTRIGYEYAGQDYAPGFFQHDGIALNADTPETGAGPCAFCHMGDSANHTFSVVEKDAAGVIIDVPNKAQCDTCHTPGASYEITADKLEHEAEGFHETLEILETQLGAKGAVFQTSYPYFSTGASGWINQGVFGAAHNYNYLHHEPGAYAHNRFYTKRLLFDSIDWLDNYTLDGTINIDATVYPDAAEWMGAATQEDVDADTTGTLNLGDVSRP
ncbi:MAG: hypothetical protein C0624_03880 [Desulfuromonas sp.]|nr:MAG: hypothetical protein C0624_03880 [Desulfuromonas sp.]